MNNRNGEHDVGGFPGFFRWLIVSLIDKLAALMLCFLIAGALGGLAAWAAHLFGAEQPGLIIVGLLVGVVSFVGSWFYILLVTYKSERRLAVKRKGET